ncbi:MAG: phosphatase PAP2 family protein [Planctomycetia bacterium]
MTERVRNLESRPRPTAGRRGRLLALAAVAACLGAAALSIDLPVARAAKLGSVPGDLRRFVNFFEVAAHGMGVAVLCLGIAAFDPTLWRRSSGSRWLPSPALARLIGAAYAGGMVVNTIKMCVVRVRPRAIDLAGVESVFETFGSAAAEAAGAIGSAAMSFPSGHSAVAAGFAAAVACRYPRATWYCVFVALAAMAQRVIASDHYPSDVGFGAAIGLVSAAVCLGPRLARRSVAP